MQNERDVLTRNFAESRKKQVSNVKYELFLGFKPKSDKYFGKCTVKFVLHKKNDGVILDSISRIKKIIVNGNVAKYENGKFSIKLNDKLEEGKENRVEIDYEADYDHSGDGLHQFIDSEDGKEYIYSNFEPYEAHRMLPCFDQPDIKATLKLSVEIPREWKAISNESGKEESLEKSKIVKFLETKPISTYLFHVSLGSYEFAENVHKGIPMKIYFRKSIKPYVRVDEIFEVTKTGLDFYSKFFDYEYPFSKYDQIFVPEFNSGAMENPGAVTFSERYLVRRTPTKTEKASLANVILHEMAHMWFGDLVTMKWWDDLWLNESFADFVSYFAMSKSEKFKDAWEDFYARKAWAYYQDQLITTHPIATNANDTDVAFSNFDGISYSKGAAVLKQLMFYIGEENFRNGLRKYFKKYEWQNTELKDFLECLEDSCGKKLGNWFDGWIRTTGVNSALPNFKISDGRIKDLKIIQKPSEKNNLFMSHKSKIAFFTESSSEAKLEFTKEIVYDKKETKIDEVDLKKEKLAFAFLNYEDWDYVKNGFDEYSLKYILKNLHKVKDSLTRQIIYGTLWQMVRDADFDPKDFLEIVLNNAPKEESLLSIERMFLRSKTFMDMYLSDKDFQGYCDKFFELSFKMLNSPLPMEMKNPWFGMLSFSSLGVSDGKFEKMIEILEGKTKFGNFEFDQDKRWSIVIRLNARNCKKSEEFLKSEMKRDKTDFGQKKAAIAEASRIENKDKFWKLFVSGEGKSLDFIRESMSGFFWKIQKEEMKKYRDLFFKEIKGVFEKRENHYAKAFSEILFPMIFADEETLEIAKECLKKNGDSHKLLKKHLQEEIDNLERTLKILKKYG